jgi:hypothetical protein
VSIVGIADLPTRVKFRSRMGLRNARNHTLR